MTNQFDEGEEFEGVECENCGAITEKQTCSKTCYDIMKADYMMDQEK
tara:strand:- start:500 stop:640 length:141 start_codon:yes stop_codon:yes gene_type:complete